MNYYFTSVVGCIFKSCQWQHMCIQPYARIPLSTDIKYQVDHFPFQSTLMNISFKPFCLSIQGHVSEINDF